MNMLTRLNQNRERLRRSHEIAHFLGRIQNQSRRLLHIYADVDGSRAKEIQAMGTGDSFEEFRKRLAGLKEFHRKYPNEQVENLEKAYKRPGPDQDPFGINMNAMFSGEESFGRFFDLTMLHEEYLNLPGMKKAPRISYVQYLDAFDAFLPPTFPLPKSEKMTDPYFKYLGNVSAYLEGFMRKTKPLEDLDKLFASFDEAFELLWENDKVAGWEIEKEAEKEGHSIWCQDCQKEFNNINTYQHHFDSKKHKKNAEARQAGGKANGTNGTNGAGISAHRLKERAIAEREFRIRKLAAAMQTERADTKHNVERRQGMTERERQQELEMLYNEDAYEAEQNADDSEDDESKLYNPLKLPLAWDGKPIPFWLYKLHGLGVEFKCEICGNYVYMGRRSFDKHFNDTRHTMGLKSLGIVSNLQLFRDITSIDDATRLNNRLMKEKQREDGAQEDVVQMEDANGNVMPEKVYNDLRKQGLL
jgi:splicing factor 3A subunit 3